MSLHPTSRRLGIILPGLRRLALVCVVALLVGWIYDEIAGLWVALAGMGYLLFVHYYYVGFLGHWLEEPDPETLPRGIGSWSNIFARLHKARRVSDENERRLRESEEHFRRTISALPEGIVVLDAAGMIEWCSGSAERHLGVDLRTDQGLRLVNMVRDPPFVAYMNAGNFEQSLVFRPQANAALILSITVIRFEPGRSIVISRDITQSERLDAMRRDFIANVSHELRTPLTVVNGFVEVLIDAQPPLDDLRRHHLALMHEQGVRMERLVADLLTLSRLESSDTPLIEESIDIARLMDDLRRDAEALSQSRHRITVDSPGGALRGSRDELFSAFGNLVSNAIRYTPSGGEVALIWRQNDDGAVFSVRDSGQGIAAEHLPRLSERFYRVDKSRSRETGGTGLGLAIVKHVLMRHQGRLTIKSQLGHGSEFSAWLPANRVLETDRPSLH